MEIDKETSAVIEFRLDPASGVPTYAQLVRQVEDALRLGYLAPGDQLPRVKDVVASLAINPNTVLKAYRELEHKGLASGRPGQGTFVEREVDIVPLRNVHVLQQRLARWMAAAADAGLDDQDMGVLFGNALRTYSHHERVMGA